MLTYTIKRGVAILVDIIELAILVRVLLSFVPNLRYSKFADIIYQLTDPILVPCQKLLDRIGLGGGMLDFSPILAFLFLRIIANIIYTVL